MNTLDKLDSFLKSATNITMEQAVTIYALFGEYGSERFNRCANIVSDVWNDAAAPHEAQIVSTPCNWNIGEKPYTTAAGHDNC